MAGEMPTTNKLNCKSYQDETNVGFYIFILKIIIMRKKLLKFQSSKIYLL